MFIDDMDRFELKEMIKIRPVKNSWYEWLINQIPASVRKAISIFKDKVVSLFKTSTPKHYDKQTVYGKERNQASQKPKSNPEKAT